MEPLAGLFLVLAIVLGATAIGLAVLWLLARWRLHRLTRAQAPDELRRVDLELANAEQAGKLKLIRELHEVTVTDLNTLIGHAEGAKYTVGADPESAARSAAIIEDAARAILADVRRVLNLVREAEALGVAEPGLQSFEELYDAMSHAGLEIRAVETGTPFPLKAGPQLAVYRILQEALERARAAGGPGTAVTVSFTWTDDSLSFAVEDERPRSGLDDDAGLAVMRERASVYDGLVSVSAAPGGGSRLTVAFPRIRYNNGIHSVNLGNSLVGE